MILIVDPDILNKCLANHPDISGNYSRIRVFTSSIAQRFMSKDSEYQFGIDAGGHILYQSYCALLNQINQDESLEDWRSSDVFRLVEYLQDKAITEPDEENGYCICLQISTDKKVSDFINTWGCTEPVEIAMLKMAWDGVKNKRENVYLAFPGPSNNNNDSSRRVYNNRVCNQVKKQIEYRETISNTVLSKVYIDFATNVRIGLPYDVGSVLTKAFGKIFELQVKLAVPSIFPSVNFSLRPPFDQRRYQCDFYGEEDLGTEKIIWIGESKFHTEGFDLPLGLDAINQLAIRRDKAQAYYQSMGIILQFRLIVACNLPEPGVEFWSKAQEHNIEYLSVTTNDWKTAGDVCIQHLYELRKS